MTSSFSQCYGVTKVIDKTKKISDIPQWFEGCRLNYAQNLLRHRDDRVAIYGLCEYICLIYSNSCNKVKL